MLHWENVAFVLQHGLCCREHMLADPDYINIGHRQLITDRQDYPVPIKDAGNLGDYIPFYFAGHSPMLYLIKNGYQGVEARRQEDIVFILCDFDKIKVQSLPFIFTDRNAKLKLAKYYTHELDFDQLDWEIIKSKQWNNDLNNLSRQDYKQAEFLVRDHLPVECIHRLVVKTEKRKLHLDTLIADLEIEIEVNVDINCKLYY